jgi:mannose-6-phosphate isomerase-like protein (cupin superfamily)
MRSDLVDIGVELKHETDRAWLVFDGAKEVWVPKSQAELSEDQKTLTMPEWLAMDKGFI